MNLVNSFRQEIKNVLSALVVTPKAVTKPTAPNNSNLTLRSIVLSFSLSSPYVSVPSRC